MGLIEQLILLAKESIDEANQRGRRPPAPVRTEEEIEALREMLANRAAQARYNQEQAEREAAEREAQQQAEQERQRHTQERDRQRQKQAKTVQATQVAQPIGGVDPRRIARLVRHPQALREMMVLSEVLGKPLALRKRR